MGARSTRDSDARSGRAAEQASYRAAGAAGRDSAGNRIRPGRRSSSVRYALLAILALQGSPLDEYRKSDFAPKKGKVDDAWKKRILLEFELVRAGKPELLRPALKDPSKEVRAFAAGALGILGDQASAAPLAELAKADPDAMVRIMALQGLGWLRAGPEAVEAARSDSNRDVVFMAGVADLHLKDPKDHAAVVREAYTAPLRLEELASARVGAPAPDFSALDSTGAPFQLSSVLKKEIVVLTFQIADW